jgi:hypothetical protein
MKMIKNVLKDRKNRYLGRKVEVGVEIKRRRSGSRDGRCRDQGLGRTAGGKRAAEERGGGLEQEALKNPKSQSPLIPGRIKSKNSRHLSQE